MSSKAGSARRVRRAAAKDIPSPADFDRAIARAARDAIARHKRLGQAIYVWQDGRVVEIPASKIRVPRLR